MVGLCHGKIILFEKYVFSEMGYPLFIQQILIYFPGIDKGKLTKESRASPFGGDGSPNDPSCGRNLAPVVIIVGTSVDSYQNR